MRGKPFHNKIAQDTKAILNKHGWHVIMEHCVKVDNITTYFDLYATKGNQTIACEVETTPRHAMDNAAKALITEIPLWIIVPSRALRRQIEQKLISANLISNDQTIRVLLLSQLEVDITNYGPRVKSQTLY